MEKKIVTEEEAQALAQAKERARAINICVKICKEQFVAKNYCFKKITGDYPALEIYHKDSDCFFSPDVFVNIAKVLQCSYYFMCQDEKVILRIYKN